MEHTAQQDQMGLNALDVALARFVREELYDFGVAEQIRGALEANIRQELGAAPTAESPILSQLIREFAYSAINREVASQFAQRDRQRAAAQS